MKQSLNKNTSILFISSTGGHFSELMKLKPIMEQCNYHIVTEKTNTNANLKEEYKDKIDFLIYKTRKNKIIYPFVLIINCFISLFLFLKYRPKLIITTGTHTAGPMCCIAKLFGKKVIYIETFANRNTKTATGRLLYHIADTFVVQWEEMLELYPKAKYWGWIF
ncbi:MAG: polysaccharide biosynthesis protein [Clostridia bacterium]|nr:polysaccharide biosynthesis protein [Clostridia bacterium]